MLMSKTSTYAIRAVLYLASHTKADEKVSIKDIADGVGIPFHFLAKILQQLSRHGIIGSIKGPGGGFFITTEQRNMPMMKVFTVFEGPEYFKQCGLGLKECSERNPCPIHYQFKPFREYLHTSLRLQSVKDWSDKVATGEIVLKV